MAKIAVLQLSEDVSVDQDELARIYIQMDSAADALVAQAIEELAHRLGHAERLFRRGDLTALDRTARAIADIAGRIGLGVLARVAGDVSTCCAAGRDAALAATLCRMVRIGDSTLREIWELRELPL